MRMRRRLREKHRLGGPARLAAAGILLAALLAGCAPDSSFARYEKIPEASGQGPASSMPGPADAGPANYAQVLEENPEIRAALEASGWGLSEESLAFQTLPVDDATVPDYPGRYLIRSESNRFERQEGNSCGGHSAAFLLRFLGSDVTGQEIYDSMNYRFEPGFVLPQGVLDMMTEYGHDVTMYRGTLEQLKTHVSKGSPVIVLVGENLLWQHYMTITGYDDILLYFYNSSGRNMESAYYNYALSAAAFQEIWENGIPCFENTYFVLS